MISTVLFFLTLILTLIKLALKCLSAQLAVVFWLCYAVPSQMFNTHARNTPGGTTTIARWHRVFLPTFSYVAEESGFTSGPRSGRKPGRAEEAFHQVQTADMNPTVPQQIGDDLCDAHFLSSAFAYRRLYPSQALVRLYRLHGTLNSIPFTPGLSRG